LTLPHHGGWCAYPPTTDRKLQFFSFFFFLLQMANSSFPPLLDVHTVLSNSNVPLSIRGRSPSFPEGVFQLWVDPSGRVSVRGSLFNTPTSRFLLPAGVRLPLPFSRPEVKDVDLNLSGVSRPGISKPARLPPRSPLEARCLFPFPTGTPPSRVPRFSIEHSRSPLFSPVRRASLPLLFRAFGHRSFSQALLSLAPPMQGLPLSFDPMARYLAPHRCSVSSHLETPLPLRASSRDVTSTLLPFKAVCLLFFFIQRLRFVQ